MPTLSELYLQNYWPEKQVPDNQHVQRKFSFAKLTQPISVTLNVTQYWKRAKMGQEMSVLDSGNVNS